MYRRTEAEQKGREESTATPRRRAPTSCTSPFPTASPAKTASSRQADPRKMSSAHPSRSATATPETIPNSEFVLGVDIVVLAIGYEPDDLLEKTTPGLRTTNWKTVRVDEDFQTTRPGVFAGGDNVNGADLVVTAMADGRRAAEAIHNYLSRI